MTSQTDVPPDVLSATRPMYWSVRRELWENRSLYIAPLVVTAVVLFATMINTFGVPRKVRNAAGDPAKQRAAIVKPFSMAPAPIMVATLLVGMFYSLDALYGERRDRSILFWKSMPVSDRTTVLSKVSIPMVVLPLLAFALSLVTQVVLFMLTTVVLLGSGNSPAMLWSGLPSPLVMIYGLTVHALWFAPIYGWLLLISAWARRTPLLWAVLPPLAVVAVERILFSTTYFGFMLQYRIAGAMREAFAFSPQGHNPGIRFSQLTPLKFLSAPGLWLGLLFAAACLAVAVRLRRNREPI